MQQTTQGENNIVKKIKLNSPENQNQEEVLSTNQFRLSELSIEELNEVVGGHLPPSAYAPGDGGTIIVPKPKWFEIL